MYFLTTEEGGNKNDLIPSPEHSNSIWCNTKSSEEQAWSVGLTFEPGVVVKPGSTHIVSVSFLHQDAYKIFKDGSELLFCAGARLIAKGIIYDVG